jgi:hypothetical protein
MKTTIVPAQITTIEDRIAGSLNLTQLLLLMVPIFGSSIEYIILPPNLHFAVYKVVLATLLLIVFGLLTVRIKGKILLDWTLVMLRYNRRPRHYVFDKNDFYLKDELIDDNSQDALDKVIEPKPIITEKPFNLHDSEVAYIQQIVSNPLIDLTFKPTKKGEMNVYITEIK